jgi:transcriptional regulator with XRE-family HTH domain
MDIYERINELLKEKGRTRIWLASEAGVSYNTLTSLFARRSKNMEIATARKIAIALNTTIDYLFTGNLEYFEPSSTERTQETLSRYEYELIEMYRKLNADNKEHIFITCETILHMQKSIKRGKF